MAQSKPMTVYDLARKCMKDPEFNRGGIVKNELTYLMNIGFEFRVKDGCVFTDDGGDLENFYRAMETIRRLNEKYSRKA